MVKMQVEYLGDLRCSITHGPSGATILTDAPVDNMGKGQSFSPTDLTSASLASCMMTIMGIVAARHSIDLKGTKISIEKEMITTPVRKIGTIAIVCQMPRGIERDKRSMLEEAAKSCPVRQSVHPDVNIPLRFEYPD